jgi:hypothetical protein
MGASLVNQLLEVKKTSDGKVFARRKDGLPLTVEDRQEVTRLAETPQPIRNGPEIREAESIQAVKIFSKILGDDIWLILDRAFIPADGLACYFAEEIPLLKDKTVEELREIHKAKLAFPGCRVIQEGAEDAPLRESMSRPDR